MVTCATCGRVLDGAASMCSGCGAPVPTQANAPRAVLAATALGPDPVPPPSGMLRPGQLFDGKYHIERQIGAGGMSVVYLATEVTVETRVVIKALLPHLSHQPGVKERLLREAKALARIDHPNVVGLKSVVTMGAELFLVMEFVEGYDLAAGIERWKTEGRPPLRDLLALFHAILDGVEAAHAAGIIHRDLKPSNVLLRGRDGRVKVTDFGIAKSATDGDHQLTSGMIGTLFYMAPEQLKADPTLDARADLYALGVLLYELLTGDVPFRAASGYEVARQHIQVPFPSLRQKAPDLPLDDEATARLDAVLARACAKDREHRFHSCDELRQALLRCLPALQPPSLRLPPTLVSPGAPSFAPSSSNRAPPQAFAPTVAGPPTASAPSSRPIASRGGLMVVLGSLAVLGAVAAWWFSDGVPSQARAVVPPPIPTRSAPPLPRPSVPSASASSASSPLRCATADDCKGSTPKLAAPLCHQGTCSYQCQHGLFDCGGKCLDLSTDPKHCGACEGPGSDCGRQTLPKGASPRCEQGRCTFTCPGAERCEKVCCAPGEQCAEGKCVKL